MTYCSCKISVFPLHGAVFGPTEQENCYDTRGNCDFTTLHPFHHATCTWTILLIEGWTWDEEQTCYETFKEHKYWELLRADKGSVQKSTGQMICRKWKYSLPHGRGSVQGFDLLLKFITVHTQIKVYHQNPFQKKRWCKSA